MSKDRHGGHSISRLSAHLVWVTKYRYHVLVDDVKYRVRELFRQICAHHEVTIVKGHVSHDHVHILIVSPPQHAPSDLMQKIKGSSSRKMMQEWADYLAN